MHSARVVGFHVFAGSQVLDAAGIVHHLRGALDLALRAGRELGVTPEIINLGGPEIILPGLDASGPESASPRLAYRVVPEMRRGSARSLSASRRERRS